MPPLFNGLVVLSSAFNKAKLFTKKFSKNSNVEDSAISLPAFPSRTNLKMHNLSVTPKMFKQLIMNLDSSKMSLKESFFSDCWKVLLVLPVFKNFGGLGKGLQLKITALLQGRKNQAHARIVRLPCTKSSIEGNKITCT